jgi:hypothetical protein
MKKPAKRLCLHRETIVRLQSTDAKWAGGVLPPLNAPPATIDNTVYSGRIGCDTKPPTMGNGCSGSCISYCDFC